MSTFADAIPVVLQHEGGWVDNPKDPGGETNFGISTLIIRRIQASHAYSSSDMETMLGIAQGTLYTPGYLKTMSVDAAKSIYQHLFWLPAYEPLIDQRVATKIFDFAVNAGAVHAHVVAQRACADCGHAIGIDGILGAVSVAAINACGPAFVTAMANEMGRYYRAVVAANPAEAEFLDNWLKRAAWGTT